MAGTCMRTTATAMLLDLTQAFAAFVHAVWDGLFVCRSLVKSCAPLNCTRSCFRGGVLSLGIYLLLFALAALPQLTRIH